MQAQKSGATGAGGVMSSNPMGGHGIVEGEGTITRANGEVVNFRIVSESLTADQADWAKNTLTETRKEQ